MAYYTNFVDGIVLSPDYMQAVNDYVFDPSGGYKKRSDSDLSDDPTAIKTRFNNLESTFQSYSEELKVSASTGLFVAFSGGRLHTSNGDVLTVNAGTIAVNDNQLNYIYVDSSGAVVVETSTRNDAFLLAEVTASGGTISSVVDRRSRWAIPIGTDGAGLSYSILDLTDTPSSYVGHGGKVLAIKQDETGIEFVTRQSSSAGVYNKVDEFDVVDGSRITLLAGITSIKSDEPLLPTLTGDDSRVQVSSTHSSSYLKWKALNGKTGAYDRWISAHNTNTFPQWWEFQFDSAVTVGRVQITQRQQINGSEGFIDFKIQTYVSGAYNDSLTITNQPKSGVLETRTYAFGATVSSVDRLRIYVTDAYGNVHGSKYAAISQIQAYTATAPSSGIGQIDGRVVTARQSILKGLTVLGDKAFVSAGLKDDSDRIFSVDTSSRSVVGDFDLDDTIIYQVSAQSSSVGGSFEYRLVEQEEAAPIAAYAPSNKLFVAVGNIVKVFSSTNGNLIEEIDCGVATEIQGLAVSTEQQKVFGASKAGAIVVIDEPTNTLVEMLTATDDAAYGGENYAVAVDDSRDSVYVTSRSTNKVLVLNTITNTLITTINVGSTPEGIALSESDGLAVCCNRTANTVSVINTTNNTVGASIAMSTVGSGAQPTAVAIDESATPSRAVVCLEAYNQVAVINLSDNQIEGRASAFAPVDAKFVPSTNEIYVAGEDGRITVIRQDN